MAKRKIIFDRENKKKLLSHARELISCFKSGVILADDPTPFKWDGNGIAIFGGCAVRFTDDYVAACRDFTRVATKMLKARGAHEKSIRTMCQKSGELYVRMWVAAGHDVSDELEKIAQGLVETVLAEAGKEYVHIEPNFLIRHAVSDIVNLGRVRSMRTESAAENTPLSSNPHVSLKVGRYPDQSVDENGLILEMPRSVWVIDVPATKENVREEAKWLIDVAISFVRLSVLSWRGHFPRVGEVESHPTRPTIMSPPHVTMEGGTAHMVGLTLPNWYEIDADTAVAINSSDVQSRAAVLFDPNDKSLAQRVAQGLGWMTRGRQAADRAERLLSFFTALEALLTSSDRSDPVTQTISRYASVIYTQDLKDRITVFNHIKGLYSLRSAVVHAGQREVLWQDVNNLQTYLERVFWIVLNRCDLNMAQERFSQSLSDATHGSRWDFAGP